jgi:hypothetical protein
VGQECAGKIRGLKLFCLCEHLFNQKVGGSNFGGILNNMELSFVCSGHYLKSAPNPFESKVLFPSRYKELDFKTIDKLCKINKDFENFIEQVEKLLTASERYVQATKQELKNFCDDFFTSDAKIEEYCNGVNIPFEKD